MKNAHLRFGFAEFEKTQKTTAMKVRLTADQFIGEPESGKAHLLSVIGGDSDVGAVYAAIQLHESLLVGGPDLRTRHYRFGEHASLYRGTIKVPGRQRPVRHLVAASADLQGAGEPGSIILHRNSPDFHPSSACERPWFAVAARMGQLALLAVAITKTHPQTRRT